MRKEEQNFKRGDKTNGITLIALVITIIVLLILAGVSIAMLTGQNGILGQADLAKKETEIAEAKEQAQLEIANWKAEEIRAGRNTELTNSIIESLLNNAKGKNNENYIGEVKTDRFTTKKSGYEIQYSEIYNVTQSGGQIGEIVGKDFTDEKGNEWVWVEVPKNITSSANTDVAIETALQEYAIDYRRTSKDTYYEGCGLGSETEYNNLKSKMLQSIKENGGFHIGKYEMGTNTKRISGTDKLTTPLIQQDKYVYNYVTVSQAQSLASQLSTEGKTSSLMFGIQWDLVCKYIEEKGGKTQEELKTNSTNWGNYYNATFDITKGKYSTDDGGTYTDVTGIYSKPVSTSILLTTGASERNKVLNIYDLSGNAGEFTLENNYGSDSYPCIESGGYYSYYGDRAPAAERGSCGILTSTDIFASRPALY